MKELVKQIRQYIGLSQTQMAKIIGVKFATINRWENGHSSPAQLAQEKLLQLCDKYAVPVYDMVVQKINNEINCVQIEDGRILLYHGSKNGLSGDIAPISREKCDFGKGFYMGTTPEQALTLICDFEQSEFYVLSVDMRGLNAIEIPANLDWAMLVAFNRGKMQKIKGSKLYDKFSTLTSGKDFVIGNIADDRMFYVIDNFFQENITDTALVHSLSALQLGKQYVAITQKACNAIRVEKSIRLGYFEKKVLQKASMNNRQKGIDLANEICKSYRREGKYFDEILDEALKGDNL